MFLLAASLPARFGTINSLHFQNCSKRTKEAASWSDAFYEFLLAVQRLNLCFFLAIYSRALHLFSLTPHSVFHSTSAFTLLCLFPSLHPPQYKCVCVSGRTDQHLAQCWIRYSMHQVRQKVVLWLKIFWGYTSILCLCRKWQKNSIRKKITESSTPFLWSVNTLNVVHDQRFNL